MSRVKKIKLDTKAHFIIYAVAINVLILSIFTYLLPDTMKGNENNDYRLEYKLIALNIINGENYNYFDPNFWSVSYPDDINPEDIKQAQFRRPPVFPVLIALSYKLSDIVKVQQYDILVILQYFLYIASSIMVFFLYLKWVPDKKIGFFASVLYSSYPLGLYLLKQPNSEVIFNFLLILFALLLSNSLKSQNILKKTSIYSAGLVLGLLFLTRSIVIFLPIVLFAFFLIYFRRNLYKIFIGLILGASLVILPWQNYSNNLPVSVVKEKNNFSSTVFVYGLHWESIPGRNQSKSSKFMSDDLLQFMKNTREQYELGLLNTKKSITNYLFNEIVDSPLTLLELAFWKGIRPLYATDTKRYELEIFILNLLYFTFLLALLVKRKKYISEIDTRILCAFTMSFFMYFYCMAFLVTPIIRYSLSGILLLVPLISLLAVNSDQK